MQVPIVETERLILCDFELHDLDELSAILGKPAVMRYMPGGNPFPRVRAEKTLRGIIGHWEERGFGWWAVRQRDSPNLIGWCGLTYLKELDEVEVAYLFDEPHWRKGFATEAALASLRYGFNNVGLDTIVALAHVDNIASRRVMEKCGMTYVENLHLWGLELAKYTISRVEHDTRAGNRPD
jgi:ribosomal-protein-alanine N-acetyltransferase